VCKSFSLSFSLFFFFIYFYFFQNNLNTDSGRRGPWEALLPASIGDVWFVHERGFRIGIFNLGILGGINLVSPIAGTVIERYGWRNCMYGMGGAYVLQTLLVFFFMPESAYHRESYLEIDVGSRQGLAEDEKRTQTEHEENATPDEESRGPSNTRGQSNRVFLSLRDLLPWSGYSNKVPFFWITVRPFQLILSPVAVYCTIIYTTCIAWIVLIAVTISQIFSAPPYNFTVEQVGATNVSSFVASMLGALVAQPLSDGMAVYLSRLNGGVFG
jgi:hypothetical protein